MCHPAQGLPAQCSTNIERFPDMWPEPLTTNGPRRLGQVSRKDRSLLPVSVAWRVCYSSVGAGVAVVASIGCRADTVPRRNGSQTPPYAPRPSPLHRRRFRCLSNPADTNIRRDLNLAIARDADLRNRQISFIVTNGDVSVTGTVRTEQERRKINDLAMNIGGVKSVANALLVAE